LYCIVEMERKDECKLEKSTVIGLLAGILAIGTAMVLKGASLAVLWNPAAILIIFVGTFASLFMAFPMSDLKKLPKLFKLIFVTPKLTDKVELIHQFVEWGSIARREGLLALESIADSIDDDFLKNGMKMLIDGSDNEYVKDVLLEDIHAMEERHRAGAQIFSQAGTYAPTLGVLGAVIGLIAALGNMSNIEQLGQSIAAAFVATLLGIFSGYVLWHPIANKLRRLSQQEAEVKLMIVEGLLTFGAGGSPISIKQKLMVFLTAEERRRLEQSNMIKEGISVVQPS